MSYYFPYQWSDWLRLSGLAVIYLLCGHLIQTFLTSAGHASLFWIPGGIALAALLLWGKRYWPALLVGSFALSLISNTPLINAAVIAVAHTLETLATIWLLHKLFSDFDVRLNTAADFLKLANAAGISAFISPLILSSLGYFPAETLFQQFYNHWQGDMLAMLVITPLLLVWQQRPEDWFSTAKRSLETLAFMSMAFLVGQIVFLDWFQELFALQSRGHWLFLLVLWAALRFGRHGVLLLLMVIALQAQLGAHQHKGFFADDAQLTGLQNVWAYLLVISVVGILLTLNLHARRLTEQQLVASTELLNTYFESALDLFCIADTQGYFRKLNPRWQQVLGYSIADLEGCCFLDLIHPDDKAATLAAMAQLSEQQAVTNFVNRYQHQDGSWRWIQWNSHAKGHLIYAAARDISEQKASEDELRLAALVYQNSSEAMMITDADNRIISINPAFSVCTGYSADEILGKNPRVLSSGRQSSEFYQAMWQALNTTGRWQGEIYNRRKNAETYVEWVIINTVYNDDDSVKRRVALFSDITEKKKSEEIIWFQANYDPLTQLPNRRLFADRLQQEMLKAERDQQAIGLLFIDLDRFKEVNDSLGHGMGDEMLVQVAQRISRCVRKSDTVARLGGDEFTVIVPELNDYTYVEKIAHTILQALEQPFSLGESKAYVSASIGITLYPEDTDQLEDLIRYADQAMYAAKSKGRNGYCYFTPAMQAFMEKHTQIAGDLRHALGNSQCEVYYQPIVDLTNGEIYKAEALIRWQHPERGLIMPGEFIAIAEETGIINDLGDWVFKQAAQQVQHWQQVYRDDFQISINKSPVQFQTCDDVHNHWTEYLEKIGLSGNSIVVEITEGLLLDASHQIAEKLLHFRDSGIQIAIDDFGTGYSALSYLEKFHIDYLKIDQSFTRNLAPASSDLALCEAIVVMAHKLGLQVIAEGVETDQQHRLLLEMGCDYGQGYLFSKPVPAAKFEQLLVAKQQLMLQ